MQVLRNEENLRREKLREKDYYNVAYIDGHINALMFLLTDDEARKSMPWYYIFGVKDQPVSLAQFTRMRKDAHRLHQAAHQRARKLASQFGRGIIPIHLPVV